MARDDEQQAMTSERLAELRQRMEAIPGSIFVTTQKQLSQTFLDRNELVEAMEVTLAEVERLRGVLNERASLPRDKREQRDRREATLLEIARAVANGGNAEDFRQRSAYLLNYHVYASEVMREKARALLASAEAEAGEQAAQGEA